MSKIWQIDCANHRSAINVLTHRDPKCAERRAAWGDPEYIFVVSRNDRGLNEQVSEWLNDTGIPHWIEAAGAFFFVEFKSQSDAVAFKLRWV